MQDIPFFSTQFGVASLTLNQIPYTSDSYIRIQATTNGAKLLKECVDFCRAAGAERIYATGDQVTEQYPFHTQIWKMCCKRTQIPETDAALVPVNADTLEQWRSIYNEKMRNVPNAAVMTLSAAKMLLETKTAFFVLRDELLLGIGAIEETQIKAIASVVPGSGADIVSALNSALSGETVYAEVASENNAAIRLYKRLGFAQEQIIAQWHKII